VTRVALPSRVLSLFSGIGGLDLALELAFGARAVGYCEADPFCAAVLAGRMAERALGEGPIWSSVESLDGTAWRGVVDCIAGGSPCQDLSVAGARAGLDGDRSGLWWQQRRIIEEAQPAWVVWENVGGAIASRWSRETLKPSALQMSAHHTDESASSSWPTPSASPYGSSQNGSNSTRPSAGPPSLWTRAAQWPTPTATDSRASGSRATGDEAKAHPGLTLTDAAVRQWPTPCAANHRSSVSDQLREKNSRPLQEVAHFSTTSGHQAPPTSTGGDDGPALNPVFVEALMGLPSNWTLPPFGSTRSETALYHSRQQQLF